MHMHAVNVSKRLFEQNLEKKNVFFHAHESVCFYMEKTFL